MFCGALPCECDGVKKVKSKPRPTRKVAESKPAPADDIDFGSIPEATKPRFKQADKAERDLSLEAALQILRPIVSKADQKWIDKQLKREYPQELDRRVAEWKDRHDTKKPVEVQRQADTPKAD